MARVSASSNIGLVGTEPAKPMSYSRGNGQPFAVNPVPGRPFTPQRRAELGDDAHKLPVASPPPLCC